jgi:hypothetical protein
MGGATEEFFRQVPSLGNRGQHAIPRLEGVMKVDPHFAGSEDDGQPFMPASRCMDMPAQVNLMGTHRDS